MQIKAKPAILGEVIKSIYQQKNEERGILNRSAVSRCAPLQGRKILHELPTNCCIEKVYAVHWRTEQKYTGSKKQKGTVVCTEEALWLYARGMVIKIPYERMTDIVLKDTLFFIWITIKVNRTGYGIFLTHPPSAHSLYEFLIYKKYSSTL